MEISLKLLTLLARPPGDYATFSNMELRWLLLLLLYVVVVAVVVEECHAV